MNTRTIRTRALSILFVAALGTGCVSTGRYDAAMQQSAMLQKRLQATEQTARSTQRQLDDATAQDERLRAELTKLGTDADALLAEKGTLASALQDSKRRLEELRRAQEAMNARAKQYREIAAKLQRMVDAGDLRVALRDGRMVLQLSNDVLFESGRVDIKPKGKESLKQVAAVLTTLGTRKFQVAGHTDNVPIANAPYPSNWELSTARALEVVHFLVENKVSPKVLAAAGYGEFDPIAVNTTAPGRAQNRRIEITLQPNVDELVRGSDLP